MDEGRSVGTDNSPRLSGGLAEKLDKGLADSAGMDEGPGVGTDDGAGLAKGHAELEERRSEVEALRAEIDKCAADRRQGTKGTRPATRQACSQTCSRTCRQVGR